MSPNQLVLGVYIVLAAATVLLPLRWSIIAYVLLSTVDFGQRSDQIGLLNAGKAVVLPLYLLWRLRSYSGHTKMPLAPVAWILLTIYASVAGCWSFYPALALKLTGHMIASLVICCVFMRASKGADLKPSIVLPITAGVLIIAGLRSTFAPHYGEEAVRFTTFSSAQSFAALLVALYCIALCSNTLLPALRICLCIVLVTTLVFDGSRIWAVGLLTSSLLALLISDVRSWIKILVVGLLIILATTVIGSMDNIMNVLSGYARSNRIAAAVTAAYEGDLASSGLGTFRFRRGLTAIVIDQLEKSSAGELIIGHGTANGGTMINSHIKWLDPNRFFHNEWLRVIYEWGVLGMILFVTFIGSIGMFAFQGFRKDPNAYAKPLLIFMPAFLLGLTGENIIAGAGNAVSVGFLLLIGLASVANRRARPHAFSETLRLRTAEVAPELRLQQAKWAAPTM